MSDQTPPTDPPATGDHPTTPTSNASPVAPPVPPVAPVAPPVPPYPTAPYAGGPYSSGPQHPAAPYANAPYANAPYPTAPVGYTGYAPAGYSTEAAVPTAKKPGGLGLVALLLAIAAAVIAPIVGAVAAFQVGLGAAPQLETMAESTMTDLSFLTPVREWVLLGEIAFWAGTVLGIWAIVQGIVAIVKRRGLGTGIAAVVVAVVGLFIFGTVVYAAGIAGVATGASGVGIGA